MSSVRSVRSLGWRVALAVATLGSAVLLAVLPPDPAARAFAPPIVDIPKCYPRAVGDIIDCPTDLRNNGWGEAGTSTVVGTAAPGRTYRVVFHPRVPACQSSSQSGCYTRVEQYAPGAVYFLKYGASLSDLRLATYSTETLSSHSTASWSPGYGTCKADWNPVYGDGYDFAARAAAVLDCPLEFRYTGTDGTQVPLDRLLGPTWVRVSSSITICDAATAGGCSSSHGESVQTLVRLDGDMWRAPVATCQTVSQSGPGGSDIRFDGDSTNETHLDTVKSWAFTPAGVTVRSNDGFYRHNNTAYVTGAPPGTLRATYLLQSWQGSSEATCTATVQPYTPPTPPTPPPTPTPTPPVEPTPPAPTCGLSGTPELKGAARVGTKVKVLAPGWRLPEATLSYRWKAGSAQVGKDAPKLKLTEAMRGRKLTVTVSATAPACGPHQVTLRAGKVRAPK